MLDNIQTSWRNLTKKAKLKDFRLHDPHHSFASNLVMAGVDLNTVRELLGHGDIKMTLRYSHLAHEHTHRYTFEKVTWRRYTRMTNCTSTQQL